VFTEGEKAFFEVFNSALKPQKELKEGEEESERVLSSDTLLEIPHHLIYSLYMLKYLKAKDHRIKLLYILNAFRSI
jgi:hypothetical protein